MWKPPFYEPRVDEDLEAIGSLHIQANCLIQCSGEPGLELKGESRTIFNGDAWESEIVWQVVRILMDDMGRGKADVREALDNAILHLNAMP